VIKADLRKQTEEKKSEEGVGEALFSLFAPYFCYPLSLLGVFYLFYGIFIDFCEIISW
jgi:hypothetical protein